MTATTITLDRARAAIPVFPLSMFEPGPPGRR